MIVFPALPVRNANVSVVYFRQVFTPEECRKLIASAKPDRWEEGMVGGYGGEGGFREVAEARSCRQQRLPVQQNGYPLDRICADVCQANSAGWQFELSGLVGDDLPWIMRYDADGRGHNDWHVDIGKATNASRKLGFSLQLSDSSDYAGGDLEFHNLRLDPNALRQIGTLAVFPAYWLHRVSPVTKGRRYAIVGWFHGPSFR